MTEKLKIRPKHDLEIVREPIKAPKWVNIDFTKSGKHFASPRRHPSEEEAKKAADWENALCEEIYREKGDFWVCEAGKREFLFSDFSHTLQMPVRP